MKKLPSLSIFFPAYNDEKSISSVVEKAFDIAPKVALKYEIYVVNDGSKDGTKHELCKLQKKFPSFKAIHHENNQGYGAALRTGFDHASMEYIFYTDGDGQYNPLDLAVLVSKWNSNTDVVNGYKIKRADSVARFLVGRLYRFIVLPFSGIQITDVQCDFRLMKTSKVKSLHLTATNGAICYELVSKLTKNNAIFKEIGVNHYNRPFGHSQFFTLQNILITIKEYLLLRLFGKATIER